VTVTADRVLLSGDGESFTDIASGGYYISPSGGGAGNVTVTAGSLEVRNGAGISAQGNTSRSGNVIVTADRIFLSGDGEIKISTGITAIGSEVDAGNVTIQAGSLEVRDGAEISTDAWLGGVGGNVTVTASNLEVRNGAEISTGFSTGFGGEGHGHGGNVTVTADRLFLSGDDRPPIYPTGIFADALGGGAGNVTVTAGNLEVRNGAEISVSVLGPGQGGNVKINAMDITLQDGGRISAESIDAGQKADAGNIILKVRDLLHLSNDSSITTSVTGGTGNGGNITLNSVLVVLDEGSRIIANAEGGQGGNILIHIRGGGALFRSPDSQIEASSGVGLEGSVVIDAPDTDIIAGFAGLPANFLDAATVLTQLCAGRSGANVSSLVVRKYEVLPDSPYALWVQLPRAIPTPRTTKQSRTPRTYYAGGPLPPMISCLGNG
jgi:large exoprotein involved in heme utilization and adhesion